VGNRQVVQLLAERSASPPVASRPVSAAPAVGEVAKAAVSGAGGALPHLDRIQRAFGTHDVSGIVAHADARAAASARAMGAHAFTRGDHVAFAGAPSLYTAAHEAAHAIQQRAGVSLPHGIGQHGDAYERHADAVADRVMAGQSAQELLDRTPGGGGLASRAPVQPAVQCREDISGSYTVSKLGTMTVAFEERLTYSQSGVGEYGVIRFDPAPGGTEAKVIDLVQIASMRSNKLGQAEHVSGGLDEPQRFKHVTDPRNAEEDFDTSGNMPLKDAWRIGGQEGFHIDLTGDKLEPRTSLDDKDVESAYNAERRGTAGHAAWDDPMAEVTESSDDKIKIEPHWMQKAKTEKARKEQAAKQGMGWRKIEQRSGMNLGKAGIRETELHDFPCTPEPAVFAFQTTVVGDGRPWMTAKWGFTVVKDLDDSPHVASVQGPDFVEGGTKEMTQAQANFDDILGNRAGYTSLERLTEAEALLKGDAEKKSQGKALLAQIRDAFLFTLNKLIDSSERSDGKTVLPFLTRHLGVAKQVLALLEGAGMEDEKDTKFLVNVFGLAGKAHARLSKS
jgi:hypothetical protein